MSVVRDSDHGRRHVFGQDQRKSGEAKTIIVIVIAALMMVVEITTGLLFGSMALLADGLHMATHTLALAISAIAYVYARRHADDPRFSFGTGKVNSLAGFTSAVLLAGFAALMAWESIERFLHPTSIQFTQAIAVAVVGLGVNVASALVLNSARHSHDQPEDHGSHHHVDHNLRAAYIHVVADALTSILAIAALVMGKYLGWTWLDPVMGIVGALLVGRWSIGLLRMAGSVLLDRQAEPEMLQQVRQVLEAEESSIVKDLHLWPIGPGLFALSASITVADGVMPERFRSLFSHLPHIVHTTFEISQAEEL